MDELLKMIKERLRVSSIAFDQYEIVPLIKSAVLDLNRLGIVCGSNTIDESDDLIKQAVVLYCKGYFGYDETSAQFQKAYENLRDALSLCDDYRQPKEDE